MEVWTTSDRLLEGIGTAIFLSLCFARAACTASVCTSGDTQQFKEELFIHSTNENITEKQSQVKIFILIYIFNLIIN